jgi:hypothetical protein
MEHGMGHKPSNNFQSDPPESGGANRDMSRESDLAERDKARFASEQAKRESAPRDPRAASSPFSIDNEPNNEPDSESREP